MPEEHISIIREIQDECKICRISTESRLSKLEEAFFGKNGMQDDLTKLTTSVEKQNDLISVLQVRIVIIFAIVEGGSSLLGKLFS